MSTATRTHAGEPDPQREVAEEGAPSGETTPERVGRYRIQGELGRGGVGVVYEAFDEQLERTVALKTLIAGRDASETQIQRFLREVKASAHLRHPHIVAVHDAGEIEGRYFLAMQLIDGKALDQTLEERGHLGPRETVKLLLPIVRALGHAHQEGFVHRDVKPENVLVDAGGEAYLTDFGLALDLSEVSRLTRTHQSLGTPAFMAPEQLRGRNDDPRVDIYAVGATLYECLTGHVPFEAEAFADLVDRVMLDEPPPPRALQPSISRDLEAVVLKCLEKDPARRYESAAALASDLERFLAGEAVLAAGPTLGRRLRRRLRRHRPYVLGASVALLGLLGGVAFAWWVEGDAAAARRQKGHLETERRRLLTAHRLAVVRLEQEEAKRLAFVEASLASTTQGQVAAYDRFLKTYPDAWEGRVARARMLRSLAHELRVRRSLAESASARKALLRALADLRLAVEAAAQPAPILLLEAEILRCDLKDRDAARAAFEALARSALPEDGGVRFVGLAAYARARLAAWDGRPEEALAEVLLALGERPDLTPAQLLEGELLLDIGRADEALVRLDRLAGQPVYEAEVICLRGESLRQLGNDEEARRDALRAVELDPGEPLAHLLLGRVRLEQGEPGKAVASFDRSLKLDARQPTALLLRARAALAAWGDLPRALQDITEARARGALDPSVLELLRAEILERAKAEGIVLDEAVQELLSGD